jgi:FMN phosphatase YigB (HAD superfamily)
LIRGILFDLDGTLLDIDLESFLSEYFSALGPVLADVVGDDVSAEIALAAVVEGTNAMCRPHPGSTNREVFNQVFLQMTGADLGDPAADTAIEAFYRDSFPRLQREHGPRRGARQAFNAAVSMGLTPVLATNPIFPRSAILERLRWAGFRAEEFAGITSYEGMRACKPMPDYFRQAAGLAQLDPEECVMVGDDPVLDTAAAETGMRVFYVGPDPAPEVEWTGSLEDLTTMLLSQP